MLLVHIHSDRKEASLYLKPMLREERKRIHVLAEFYGLRSVSYDNDPKRFVALIKAPGACLGACVWRDVVVLGTKEEGC